MNEPKRLRDTLPEAGAAIDAFKQASGPTSEAVGRLASRLAPYGAQQASARSPDERAGGPGDQAMAGSTTVVGAKLWIVAGVVVGALGLGMWLRRPQEPEDAGARVPSADTLPGQVGAAPPLASSSVARGASDEHIARAAEKPAASQPSGQAMGDVGKRGASVSPPRRRPRGGRPATRAVRAPVLQPVSQPAAELALLRAAQGALQRRPARALELAGEHREQHPKGVFAQERELIAIEALMKLKQRRAAQARAEAFVAQFPGSAHRRRLRALLRSEAADGGPTNARTTKSANP